MPFVPLEYGPKQVMHWQTQITIQPLPH